MRSGMRAPLDSPSKTSGSPRCWATCFTCLIFFMLITPRRAQHGEVVGDQCHFAPLDAHQARDLAVGRRAVAHRARDPMREHARLAEAAGIDQVVDALACVEVARPCAGPAFPRRPCASARRRSSKSRSRSSKDGCCDISPVPSGVLRWWNSPARAVRPAPPGCWHGRRSPGRASCRPGPGSTQPQSQPCSASRPHPQAFPLERTRRTSWAPASMPISWKVGMSGAACERCGAVIPIGFSLPALICGSSTGSSAKTMFTWPAIASLVACAPPL